MRWERRKPLWPVLVALGLLFVLAVAAPRCWKGYGSLPSKEISAKKISSSAAPNTAPQFVPASPAEPELDVSLLLEPFAETSPHVVVPHVVVEFDFPTVEVDEPLPQRSDFDLDRLLAMRDRLLEVVAPGPTIVSPRLAPPVRVANEQDRLAMLPQRLQRPHRSKAQARTPKIGKDEPENFAEILLRASRSPEQISRSEPRLAMRIPQTPARQLKTAQPPAMQLPPTEEAVELTAPLARAKPPLLKHRPVALTELLEGFSASTPGAVWSQQVLTTLRQLTEKQLITEAQGDMQPNAAQMLDRLESLHEAGLRQNENNSPSQNRWHQATQALGRRLGVWRLLLDPRQPSITGNTSTGIANGSQPTSATLMPTLNEIATLLEEEKNGADWRDYLLLDRIAAATSEGIAPKLQGRTKLAQEVLSRMDDPRLSERQLAFLATSPMVRLHSELRVWAAGKVNLKTLAALIERYETGREMRFAAAIAQLQQRLMWSDDPRLQALGTELQRHYRGANMRIAMSNDLMNRMMPKQEPIITPIRDRVAGAKVRGRARTTTQLRVRLLPDDKAWRFGLEAYGKVYTDTRSDTWPARVRNAARMQYQARKEISIDAQGLHIKPTQAKAQGRNELIGVDSQLDPIPIFGHLLRDLARQKNNKSRPTAMNQAKSKVVRRVKQRMDTTTDKRLEALEQRFRDKVLAPLERLAILAEPLDIHTTQQRAVMQLRLANQGQLAAHTQRPLAPSDSLLSLQLHETVLNNAIMGLELDGRRMKLLELHHYFAQRFGKTEAQVPSDLPRHAVIEFAARDAIRVQCEGDRLHLVLSIAELAHRRDKIKNFQVHVYFRPLLNGLDVRLVRDGTLQFSGRRLKTGPRVVLHSIIGKLLAKGQEIQLLNPALIEDPRLKGLMITQLVLEDGWIGLALGPAHARRTAWRAPQPELIATPFVR